MSKVKQLFSTPGKAAASILVVIAVVGIIAAGAVFAGRAVARSRAIGESRAEQIALVDAGEKASQARFSKTEFDFDDGQFVYEVEFFTDNGEYEYTIAASDGKILDRDIDRYSVPLQSNGDMQQNSSQGGTGSGPLPSEDVRGSEPAVGTEVAEQQPDDIGLERAKEIALEHAGLDAGSVTFTEAARDRDDGINVYEIEFIYDRSEYEYKIQASDGRILEYDVDANHHHDYH